MWNYAELAHVAKLAGGPEMLIEAIARKGFQAGVNSMNVPLIIVGSGAFLLGCGVTAFISKHNQKVKQIGRASCRERV